MISLIARDHPETMKDYDYLLARSSSAASCPGVWFVEGEHAVLDGGLATCFQTPNRVYVGLEPLNFTNEVRMGQDKNDHKRYDPRIGRFIPIDPKTAPELAAFSRVLEKVKFLRRKGKKGFIVRTLNELRPGAGCNWSGTTASALEAAIMHLDGELSQNNVASWKKMSGQQLTSDPVFDKCFRSSWILESEFHRGKASGYGNFCSLVSAKGPICYYTVSRGRRDSEYPLLINDNNIEMLWKIPYGGFRFEEEYDINDHSLEDIEIALIFTGQTKDTGRTIDDTREVDLAEIARLAILELYDNQKESNQILDKTLFLKLSKLAKNGSDLRSRNFDSLVVCNLEVFAAFKALLMQGKGTKDRNLDDFADAIKRLQHQLNQLGLEWWEERALEYYFYKLVRKLNIFKGSSIKLTGGGKGGTMVCVMPRIENIKEELTELITQLRDDINSDFSLDWLLSRDGFPESGLRLEDTTAGTHGILYKKLDKFSPGQKLCTDIYSPADVKHIMANHTYLDIDEEVLWIKGREVSCLPFGRIAVALALYSGGHIDSNVVSYVCDEQDKRSYQSHEFRFYAENINKAANETGTRLKISVGSPEKMGKMSTYRITIECEEDVYIPKSMRLLNLLKLKEQSLKKP